MPTKNKKTPANRAQSDFLNLTSHQLRTPLSGIRWLLELLQKSDTGNLNKKQRGFIEKIYSSNERMIAQVNDLLEVTRIEQGQTKLFLQPTDLATLIRGLIKVNEIEIREKKLQIKFTTEQEPFPPVRTELNKIKQAVGNVISNAIQYTKPGGLIAIDLRQEGQFAQVSVADTGVGIPSAQQGQVFNRFFRATNVLMMETTGAGLGLFIAKAFIEASGGKIWFKSPAAVPFASAAQAANPGTTLYFTLPLVK